MNEDTEERIARALESIAASLLKLANPMVTRSSGPPPVRIVPPVDYRPQSPRGATYDPLAGGRMAERT